MIIIDEILSFIIDDSSKHSNFDGLVIKTANSDWFENVLLLMLYSLNMFERKRFSVVS